MLNTLYIEGSFEDNILFVNPLMLDLNPTM